MLEIQQLLDRQWLVSLKGVLHRYGNRVADVLAIAAFPGTGLRILNEPVFELETLLLRDSLGVV